MASGIDDIDGQYCRGAFLVDEVNIEWASNLHTLHFWRSIRYTEKLRIGVSQALDARSIQIQNPMVMKKMY